MDFGQTSAQVTRKHLRRSTDENRYEWISETAMVERGYAASRISLIKAQCVADGTHRKDLYDSKITLYKVLITATSTDSNTSEDSVETFSSACPEASSKLLEMFNRQKRGTSGVNSSSSGLEAASEPGTSEARFLLVVGDAGPRLLHLGLCCWVVFVCLCSNRGSCTGACTKAAKDPQVC